MILILSDIHLADTPKRKTINLASLCSTISTIVDEAKDRQADRLKVLLLGDIFEVLKSQVWIDENIRPWDPVEGKHVAAVGKIFSSIARHNALFFDTLSELRGSGSNVDVIYVPGNHDWPVNGSMGAEARAMLVKGLALDHDPSEPFIPEFSDQGHGLIASHGHEYDPANRTDEGKIALGDAIVIEVLLTLPRLVARNLGGWSEYDDRLGFLHELDNVRPQSGPAMASWLLAGTLNLAASNARAAQAVNDALGKVLENLRELRKRKNTSKAWHTETRWIDALAAVGQAAIKRTDVVTFAAGLSPGDDAGSYADLAKQDWRTTVALPETFHPLHIAYGHTHLPEHVALGLGSPADADRPVYFNTGTWRRVHRFVRGADNAPLFAHYEEETYVVLYSEAERNRGAPRYEFKRVVRG